MPRQKNIEEEEIISNEEEEFLTMELEDLPPEDSEEEVPRFSIKQKLILVGSGFISFLLFLILLFPYENIVRQVLNSSSNQPSMVFFRELSVSVLLGEVSVKSLEIMGQSFRMRANKAEIQAGLLSLIRKKINGDFDISGIKVEYDGEQVGTIDALEGHLKIDSLVVPASRYSGSFSLKMPEGSRGFLPGMPELPLLGKIENFRINKILITSKLDQGNLEFEEFLIDTSIGRLDLHGNLRLADNFAYSQLNLRICFELERDFATEREDIAGMLALLEKSGGGKCVPITGLVQRPEVKIPGLNGPAGPPNGGLIP
ncbi:type II secretion system protein GspN [Leptospira langatensis]|uniref:Type II secretion system protein GspN n=1 Tax=Leptospira langatensis TaxID=2484983 RepID=A0A5F1ZYK6_9LEPT|nr:type II secretion system protein GspN [Leptospira langatensis]TGK04274.1 type II secretion system protein GspN [Leptospira langatensis]TGL43754.1 type II secretion system protein GspN [Leptospira langatensis]